MPDITLRPRSCDLRPLAPQNEAPRLCVAGALKCQFFNQSQPAEDAFCEALLSV